MTEPSPAERYMTVAESVSPIWDLVIGARTHLVDGGLAPEEAGVLAVEYGNRLLAIVLGAAAANVPA